MLGQASLENQCPECKERQYVKNDINYLKLFGTCWDCDNRRLMKGELRLQEFLKREQEADKK